jgi:CubicO group peptidase (beta-lactamase class C family)
MKPTRRGATFATTMVAGLCLLSACSSDSSTTESTSPAPAVSEAPAASTEAPAPSEAPATTDQPDTTVADTEAPTTTPTTDAPTNDAAIEATRALYSSVTPESPGCAVAVVRDGEVIFTEAYGAAGFNPTVPLTPEMRFDVGSTSKQFTATAVQLLADQGLVDWNAALSTYFPELPAWAETVTVLQVAHHTSGIPDYIGILSEDGVAFEDLVTNEEMFDSIAAIEALEFEPGTTWSYSNSNYVLLGFLVERASGDTLANFVTTNLFAPAGLDSLWDVRTPIEGQAPSFQPGAEPDSWVEVEWQWPQMGDGGVIATAAELAMWGTQYYDPTVGTAAINEPHTGSASSPRMSKGSARRSLTTAAGSRM